MSKIKVMIVDDHTILRDGIRSLLALYDDIEVVGEAIDGRQAVEQVQLHEPDVVLMDIAMPLMDGLEATHRIRECNPNVKIIILTQHERKDYIIHSLRAGASGCVLKKALVSELVSAIRVAHAEDVFLDPAIAKMMVKDYLQYVQHDPYSRLSRREREVLKLVAEGRSTQEIADLLSVSYKTILGHRNNVMEKLGIHNRTELIKYAIRSGLISLDN